MMWSILDVSHQPKDEPEFLADDPSPEEIRAECLKIQTTWSESERLYRAGFQSNLVLEPTRLQIS